MEHIKQFVVDLAAPFRYQVEKRQTRYEYLNGPMYFLAQQIVRAMQDAGYPAFIWCFYRPPEQQQQEFDDGDSKARPWQSPHQYFEAVDILHPKLYWSAPQEYWDTLNACVQMVERKFKVKLTHGYDWGWDSAHIELQDWKRLRAAIGARQPTPDELRRRFQAVLPKQWKQFERSVGYSDLMANANSYRATALQYPFKPGA